MAKRRCKSVPIYHSHNIAFPRYQPPSCLRTLSFSARYLATATASLHIKFLFQLTSPGNSNIEIIKQSTQLRAVNMRLSVSVQGPTDFIRLSLRPPHLSAADYPSGKATECNTLLSAELSLP
jgi:hypothetical protein